MASESLSKSKKSDALPSPSVTPGPGMPDSQTRSEGETPRYSRGRLSRGKGLRKTTGCLTCRRRHVKCDENKPRCGPCAKRRVSCSYASNEDRRQTPRQPSSRDGTSDHTATPAARVPESTVSEPMGPPRMVTLVTSTGERDDQQDQGLGMDSVVSPEAEWTEDSSSAMRDRATHPGGSFSGDLIAAGGQYEFHAIETSHTHPSTSRAAGPDSLDGISSLPYGVRSPAPVAPYQAHCQFTGYPGMPVESPTTRWLDLLIGDATIQNGPLPDWEYDSNGLDVFGNSVAQSPVSHSATLSIPLKQVSEPNSRLRHPFSTASTSSAYLRERIPYVGNQKREELAWKAIEPIELQPHETILFRHYTDHISLWLDLFDPCRPFGTYVPHLAMHSVGLMNAILALSARHLSITQQDEASDSGGDRPDPNDAVDYYLKTLHYSQRALQYDTYKTSLELLAISIIVSSYEMLGGSSANWGKHLEGVFWIQRSQVIHGDTGGLRQAVWWTWLCQDVWAAFREKRKPFTFWAPSRTLAELNPVEIAARSVYNYAKIVGFCSVDAMGNGRDVSARTLEADVLLQQLEEWRTYLTLEFDPLPSSLSRQNSEVVFPPVWIQPSVFAVSMQLYYCSLILVHLQRPLSGGLDDHLERRTALRDCAEMVCGIARTLTDYASSIMSSQCLFIAGMTLEDEKQRSTVLDLLDDCQKRGGWPSHSLGHDLSQIWKRSGR